MKTANFIHAFGRNSANAKAQKQKMEPDDCMLRSILFKSKSICRKRKREAIDDNYNELTNLTSVVKANQVHIKALKAARKYGLETRSYFPSALSAKFLEQLKAEGWIELEGNFSRPPAKRRFSFLSLSQDDTSAKSVSRRETLNRIGGTVEGYNNKLQD